jgi:uncharacterized protein
MFERDEGKDAENRRKHGISFADILPIFDSRQAKGVVLEDDRYDYGETRFWLICPFLGKLYHVTFTERGEVIRLISARRANAREEKEYERRRSP